MEDFRIQWKAYEYEHSPKDQDWYWAVGIISVGMAVTAVILDNVLFAVFILIGAFALAMHSARKPELVEFSVHKKGISAGQKTYLYSSLHSFSIEDDERPPKLLVKSKKMIMPFLVIPLENADADDVREFLANFLLEEELKEPAGHKFMEYLGF